ncbi:thiamine-phosphate kinase, partial [Acidithiobacillus ferrooxidans]|nr:thiamine-phosphate kinase [Acidithiobacillus ferrooxidans]
MAGGEFAFIEQLRCRLGKMASDVRLGIGDDAAWLDPAGRQLVATMDTLVAGRHFFPEVSPEDLAWKALAVNLSDLAAMGAEARWCLLSL